MKILHSKIVIYILTFVLCISFLNIGAEARDYTRFLNPTGPATMLNISGIKWFNNFQTEVLVSNLIDDNYAFVAGSKRVWVKDKAVEMSKETIMNDDYSFMIPSDFAREYFDVNSSESYVSAKAVIESKNFESFFDPRGFLLMGNPDSVYVNDFLNSGKYYVDYYTVSDAIGKITWQDKEMTDSERASYISKWREMLTYPESKKNSGDVTNFINSSYNKAKEIEKTIESGDGGEGPFSDIILYGIDTGSGTFQERLEQAYDYIKTMAVGYYVSGKKDSSLKNSILECIEYLHKWYYSKSHNIGKSSSAWTTYQFDIPFIFSNLLCLMYDDIPTEDMKKYTDSIFDHAPDPAIRSGSKQYGAEYSTNRAWKAFSFFNTAVLANDTKRMNYAMKYANQIFEWNMSRKFEDLVIPPDGFYRDGSYVFHNNVAYNAGYGTSFIELIAEMKLLTDGTSFDIDNIFGYENIYEFIVNNYLPFVVNGIEMKMVTGRHNVYSDVSVIEPIVRLISVMPEEKRIEIGKALGSKYETDVLKTKKSGSDSRFSSYIYKQKAFDDSISYLETLNSENTDTSYSKVFYCMDRAIHKFGDFTAALSMSSSRIEKYECLNSGKNDSAWYTGDGMLYTYTKSDTSQYKQSWFNNVDPYYMPGTTVDSTKRSMIYTSSAENWGLPDNDFAGGVSDGVNSVLGMQLGNKYVSGLKGNKSYFMLGDRIVCIGSGITGGTGQVYTVMDNRSVTDSSIIYVNGVSKGESTGTAFAGTNADWVWLENKMGYVMLDDSNLEIVKEQRSGSYFTRMSFLHGESPENESYAYIIYPNKTLSEMNVCYQNIGIELVENSTDAHIVKDLNNKITAANIFNGAKTIEGIRFSKPISVMINLNERKIYVADPTQKLESIDIQLPLGYEAAKTDYLSVKGNVITVNLKGIERGASYKIEYYEAK